MYEEYKMPFLNFGYRFVFREGVHDYYEHMRTGERKYKQWCTGYSALNLKWLKGEDDGSIKR